MQSKGDIKMKKKENDITREREKNAHDKLVTHSYNICIFQFYIHCHINLN